MPSWDSIPEDERPFQRRLMEVAAGFAEHVDVQVGRLVDEIERLGYGDNTLIFYYEYNLFIIQRTKIRAKQKLPVGKVKIEVETA